MCTHLVDLVHCMDGKQHYARVNCGRESKVEVNKMAWHGMRRGID
jgi:hypothetical protein